MILFHITVLQRAGVTQLVECNLAKVDVAGSNPVSRSRLHRIVTFPTSHKRFPGADTPAP